MHLGALIGKLEDETNATAALEALNDLVLFAEVRAVGARFDEEPSAYLSSGVRRFTSKASDDDWLQLMTLIKGSSDPARAALQCMLRWALAQDNLPEVIPAVGCSCSGGAGGRHDHL